MPSPLLPPVGSRLKLFWDTEGKWFEGIADAIAQEERVIMHRIRYDDGDIQVCRLACLRIA